MGEQFILAVDQGTTNTKALIVDSAGRILAQASRPLSQTYPQPAWVEQDPLQIWTSVRDVIDECLTIIGKRTPAAIALTNQRETVMIWERRTGRPLGPCVIWQCRRSAPFCEQLRARGLEGLLHERTGLTIDPLFSASKARWLLDHSEDGSRRAAAGEICIGTMDSWVLWNLTGGKVHATDLSNASRTQLLNIREGRWDPELCDLFGVPLEALPEVKASSGIFGASEGAGQLPDGVPIGSLIGDSHAALFGQAGFEQGTIKATYGTGSSLMTLTEGLVFSGHGLSTTIAWALDRITYALEGNISVTGAAVQWFGDFLGLADPAASVATLAEQVADTDGVYVVPAFVGLGAPYWDEAARGLITGLTRGSRAAHVARAVIESIAFQVRDVFDAMEADTGSRFRVLLTDGGATQNKALMQFQADILGCPVMCNRSVDVSALGAAYLAGLAVGMWSSEQEIAALERNRERFEPALSPADRAQRYAGWKDAVHRARSTTSA
ncbi:MAG TPA: glycerol kinase GlpK [Aggregatilineaceae bacterium]|nr:glycerol kinase GlpK [Aggregatilineaceae bacterium]